MVQSILSADNSKTGKIRSAFPALAVLLIFCGVLFAKGIFPFGTQTIDYYDMGQINAPLYYHAWDVLHGRASLFFDWYINEGQNIAMAVSNQWNLSPFILTFLFVPRAYLMRFLSVYLGLHLIGMTISMQYFLYKVTPSAKWYFRAAFSAAYGLCGYTLTHYTTPTFLDTAVFLPVLMLMLLRLLKYGRWLGYVLMLALSVIISYYLGIIDMIYLLIVAGAYLVLVCEKEDRPDRAGKLVLGTIAGLILSAVVMVPVFFSLMKSSRINSNYDDSFIDMVIAILRAIGADQYYVKFWQLFAMEAAGIIILLGLIRFRKEWKKTLFVFIWFFAPCALIPFESINMIWHLGSYFHYPIRCGYLIPFSLLSAASYFAAKLWNEDASDDKRSLIIRIVAIAGAITMAAVALYYFFHHDVWQVEKLFKLWLVMAVLFAAVYFVIFFFKALPGDIFIWFLLAELIIGAAIGYGKPHIYDRFFADPEQTGDYVEESLLLKNGLNIEESRLFRIKNPDTSLNANYGMIMRRATVCGWAQTLSRPVQKGAEDFGYSTHFMRILDAGGTAFTDAILGVRDVVTLVSYKDQPSIYKYTASYNDYELYRLRYAFPYINLIKKADLSDDTEENDIVGLHNMLYSDLLQDKDSAVPFAKWIHKGNGENDPVTLTEKIEGNKVLYLRKGEAEEITVNGKAVPVPTISEPDNKEYPAWFNSNLICLGEFKDEEITINCPEKSEIFSLDIDMLAVLSDILTERSAENGACDLLSAGNDKLNFDITVQGDGNIAVLPVNPDEYSKITVNGRIVEEIPVNPLLVGVPLQAGENRVEISFLPKGLIPGFIISLVMLAIVLMIFFAKDKVNLNMKIFNRASLYVVGALWSVVVLAVYIVPIAAFFVHQVIKRL